MKKYILLIILVFAQIVLFGEILEYTMSFSDPEILVNGEYTQIKFNNSSQFGETGKPSLPFRGLQLLLPPGEKAVSIQVLGSEHIVLEERLKLYPLQQQYPFSLDIDRTFTGPDPAIYSDSEVFPAELHNGFRTDFYCGHGILSTAITPIEYYPLTGEVSYYGNIKVRIETAPVDQIRSSDDLLLHNEFTVNYLNKTVNNHDMINNYNTRNTREDEIDYLIIAEESKVELWEQLTTIHNSFGRTTHIETIEYILAAYEGIDDPERIRNYLMEQFEEYAIRFVLLAGDTDVIPHRGLYGIVNAGSQNPTTDLDIPADMYYSCLDRGDDPGLGPDWNNDNDNLWGEDDEADLIPEFAIGRFPYNNDTEILNFINKVDLYLNNPVSDELNKALFVGEDLGWTAWGGDYMDEMIGGSDNFGFSTTGVPLEWDITTLYDRDSYWSAYDLYSEFNQGPNLLSHLGHSSTQYNMKLYNNDVNANNITNNGIDHNFTIIFTQGCYAGAFDNRNSNGSYVGDCITERFTGIATCAVSMVSHSRYGWGSSYDTNGASQHYNREYNDALFGEDIFELGYALNDAKIDAIPFMSNVMYWVAYQTNVIGDPALQVWTNIPEEITVTHPSDIIIGSSQIEVTTNLEDATIAILNNNALIGSGITGYDGGCTVEFTEALENLGEIDIKVSKHNYLNYINTINIIPATGPYVVCNDVDYFENGEYLDGIIQSLDLVDLDISLNNIGMEDVTEEITAFLSTESTMVNILNGQFSISELGSLQVETIEDAFQIELLSGIVDNTVIEFIVSINSGENSWESNIFLNVHGPNISFSHYDLIPTSGDDQSLDPGESAELYLTFSNLGNGYSYELSTSLFSYDPYLSITGISSEPVIAPGNDLTLTDPFNVQVSEACPEDYFAELEILAYDIVASGIFTTFRIPIGISGYNFEDAVEWEHSTLTNGYSDEWHIETYRNHTENGLFSMKCGGSGSSEYSAYLHAGVTSPIIPLNGDTSVTFWHWIDAEVQNATTAWDGGLIEASFNDGDFSPIQPVGGYPYSIVDNPDSPFDPGMPVFSGSHSWEQVELDLSGYTGHVQLRFVFGTDGYVGGEGWYIDDIMIVNTVDADEDVIIPTASKLKQNHPNPFNPITTIDFSIAESGLKTEISVFNTKGQKIRTLVSEILQVGNHSTTWNGKDDYNKPVGSGIYFYKMNSGDFTSIKKFILMK